MKKFLVLFLAAIAPPILGADLAGTKTVALYGGGGEKVVLGELRFAMQGDGYTFEFAPNSQAFGERFLAMRPFLCIDGETDSLCHFPYKSPQKITANDLTDLEYQFMFLRKARASVSVDPANGVYYEMKRTDKGIEGTLREVDMTPIIVPQGDMTRPIKRENLYKVDLTGRWLPRLTIE